MRKKAQFGQVISGYVDPTPEGLNRAYQRHMDNLMLSESIRQEAAKLKAAPFEGDQQLRRDLLNQSDSALQSIATKGAYGNMSNFTSAVNRASTEYIKRATPISQNQVAYTTYQGTVNDLLEKGKIDVEDANGALMLSTMGYSGLSYDENGDATNFFSGKQVWQDPGIEDMINKALSNIEPDSWKEVRKVLGAGPDGSLTVETEQGEKYISPEKVSAALAGVTNDQAVIGYYTRKGQIRTARLDDEEVAASVSGMLKAQINREKPNVEEVARLQKLVDSGKIEDMRQELINTERNNLINTPIQAAISGKSYLQQTDSVKQGYDQKWMAEYKQRLSDAASSTGLEVRENGVVYNRIGGANAGDLAVKIDDANTKLEGLMGQYESGFNDLSDQGKIDLTNQITDAERESRMLHNLFMDLYKNAPDELIDTDEYRELVAASNEEYTRSSVQGDSGAMGEPFRRLRHNYDVSQARKALRDYITNLGLESPVGATTAISVQYVDPTSVGGGTDIAKSVKNHFSAGFDGLQMVLDPDTGSPITLQELAAKNEWGDIANLEYANMGVSKGAPLATGPTMRVGIKTEQGAKSIIIPIGPEGTQLDIPGVSPYYNSHGGRIVNELLTYQNEGLENMDMPYYSEVDPSIRGTMSVDLTSAEGGTVTIKNLDGDVLSTVGLNDPSFQGYMNQHGIRLR